MNWMNTLCYTLNGYPALWHMTVYMIVTRTRLMTRLGYQFSDMWWIPIWHWLHIYSCASYLLSVFMWLSYVLLFIYLFCYLVFSICSYSYYYLCTLFFCTSFFPFTHTLTMVAFWDPGFARPDIGRCSNVQVSDEAVRFARSLGPLPLILVLLHSCSC